MPVNVQVVGGQLLFTDDVCRQIVAISKTSAAPIAPPDATGTSLEYFAHAQNRKRYAIWNWDTGERISAWRCDGMGNVTWVDGDVDKDVEHWRVRDGWIMCDGFSPSAPTPPTKPLYTADAIYAEMKNLRTGTVTVLPVPKVGHYYCPLNLPDPIELYNWGLIDGTVKMFWVTEFHPGETAVNRNWYQGSQAREVIRQREAWWAGGSWTRGTGSDPFDATGKPQPVKNITKLFEVTLAKDIGVWTGRDLATGQGFGAYAVGEW